MDTATNSAVPLASESRAKRAKVGFVLGLIGIIAWIIPIIGLPVGICGIVFSSLGLESSKRKKAIIGLTLSIIFTILALFNGVIGAVLGGLRSYDTQKSELQTQVAPADSVQTAQ